MKLRSTVAAGAAILVLGAGAAACGGSSSGNNKVNPNAQEVSPPGDIPDNQVYVAYAPPGSGYTVKVPEGWSRQSTGGAVTFTDKLNTVRLESPKANSAPTVAEAKRVLVPQLSKSVKGFQAGTVTSVKRSAGEAIRITYLAAGKPNPVTGKVTQDAVESYLFFHNGKEAVLTLSGPKGADNVDPWRIITNSLRWTQ
jgi:hypothetical protein